MNRISGEIGGRSKRYVTAAPFIIVAAVAAHIQGAAASTCPAFGADTDCGILITVTDAGATVQSTGQGPYDGSDDTLIGVINNSAAPLKSLILTSSLTIFAFDGDGVDTYGAPGNSTDTTGYGGPNAYFTNANGTGTSGTVNFITPLAAKGGTAYFSLENALGSACATFVNNSITTSVGGALSADKKPTTFMATFKPGAGLTLAQAAKQCGFTNFDWQQKITMRPTPSNLMQTGNPTPLTAPPPFFDPPKGGYTYPSSTVGASVDLSYPFYYDALTNNGAELAAHETGGTALTFDDTPKNPCLPGGVGCNGGQHARSGSYDAFTTHLMGILPGFSGGDCVALGTCVDLGIGFTWKSTYNWNTGGVSQTKSSPLSDASDGTGGVTLISVQNTTTYGGVVVTGINGQQQQQGQGAQLTNGRACNGTYTGTFAGDIDVTAGQICTLSAAKIVGHVHNNGGTLAIEESAIDGNVHSERGAVSVTSFSAIDGHLTIENTPDQSTTQICDSVVTGDGRVKRNEGIVQIGSNNPATCGGNVFARDLDVEENRGPLSILGNTIEDTLACYLNTALTAEGNKARDPDGQCRLSR